MSPTLVWPDLVPGPNHIASNKNHLTNLSKLPPLPIMRTWEFQFPIPPWILEVFSLVPGVFLEVEIFINRDQPDREENSVAISIWLNWVVNLTDRDQPHFIESSVLNFEFTWPNQYHIPYEEHQANLRAESVSEGSNETFANTDWMPGSLTNAPEYQSLSPHPPHFQSAEEEHQDQEIDCTTTEIIWSVNERISRVCSIAEEFTTTLNQVW